MKKYLLGQWVGLSFIHWLLAPTLGMYLTTFPLGSWSFYQGAIALWFGLSGLILCFWTIYLLSYYSHALTKQTKPLRFLGFKIIYTLGQAMTLLIVLIGVVRLLTASWPEGTFFYLPDRSFFWIMQTIATLQGLHHFFYKFTSGSPSRCDGLLDRLGNGEPIDWQYPIGGSIGVELRRLRRLQATPDRYPVTNSPKMHSVGG